jgi:hypothetical protein
MRQVLLLPPDEEMDQAEKLEAVFIALEPKPVAKLPKPAEDVLSEFQKLLLTLPVDAVVTRPTKPPELVAPVELTTPVA